MENRWYRLVNGGSVIFDQVKMLKIMFGNSVVWTSDLKQTVENANVT